MPLPAAPDHAPPGSVDEVEQYWTPARQRSANPMPLPEAPANHLPPPNSSDKVEPNMESPIGSDAHEPTVDLAPQTFPH